MAKKLLEYKRGFFTVTHVLSLWNLIHPHLTVNCLFAELFHSLLPLIWMYNKCLWGCMWVCASLQSCDGSEYTLQGPAGGDDITGLSAEPAHYQLLSELGENTTPYTWLRPLRQPRRRHKVQAAPNSPPKSFKVSVRFLFKLIRCITGRGFNNLSQVSMARHIPTGQLVAVKQTNLDECTEEELLQLMVSCSPETDLYLKDTFASVHPGVFMSDCILIPQNEVLLSRLFRHPNLLTSRLVFSSCCQLWVLTPLMAYGQLLPHLYKVIFVLLIPASQMWGCDNFPCHTW